MSEYVILYILIKYEIRVTTSDLGHFTINFHEST